MIPHNAAVDCDNPSWPKFIMQSRMNIAGVDIDITRKKMKNIRLVVQAPRGDVRVSAPKRVSNADIAHFVSANIHWIRDQQRLISSRDYPAELNYEDGEVHRHWGVEKKLRWLPHGKKSLAYASEDTIYLACAGPVHTTTRDQRKKNLEAFYRRECATRIPAYVARYQQAYGVTVSEWRLRSMKTRWGSCNISAARIWLNIALAAYPEHCLEYVVVHEIAHLLERNHNARFWQIVESQFPTWREAREILNRGE